MRKPRVLLAVFVCALILLIKVDLVAAQNIIVSPIPLDETELLATESATLSGELATESARTVVERVVEPKSDITEPRAETKSRLERYLDEKAVGPLSWHNFLQHAVRNSIAMGVAPNTIVLVLLFPVVAAIIAAARHLIGLRGFGIFTPAVLSVAFVATGMFVGILLFLVILLVATLSRGLTHRLKLQYLPRMSLLMWFISIGVLVTLLLSPLLPIEALKNVNIFPILILMLLAENFIEVQIGKSRQEATELTIETMILALICSLVLSLDVMQRVALLYPELLLLIVAVFNIFVGKYVGLRYQEFLKYKKLLD
jgi:hypothetical protein